MDGSPTPQSSKRVSYVEFRQRCSADFHQLHISKTCLLRIRSGSKMVRTFSGSETTVAQGEFVYLRGGENLTIGNIIGDTGLYFSEGLVIEDDVISEYLSLRPNPPSAGDIRKGPMSHGFDEGFTWVVQSLQDDDLPDTFLTYRAHELLLWLHKAGAAHQIRMGDSLKNRLRALIESQLDRAWKAPDAARELGVSEATLRRNLSKDGTGFTEILKDVRVSFALMRIQTSEDSLAEIAYKSGFSSQARLSEAFKSRFDLTPGKIRAPEARFERIA